MPNESNYSPEHVCQEQGREGQFAIGRLGASDIETTAEFFSQGRYPVSAACTDLKSWGNSTVPGFFRAA